MNNYCLKNKELFSTVPSMLKEYFDRFTYPWELLPKIKNIVAELLETNPENYTLLKDGVLVGKNVKISPTAVIDPPTVICDNVEIRSGAFIRGNVIICENSVVGNSTELKNCILLNNANAPHFNYVGDSILGSYSHLGAGVICSNLKSDKKNIVVHADVNYETGLRKFGAILGDYADIGCNSVLTPGTVIGKNTQVYPLTMTRGAYRENLIVKSTYNFVIKEQ